uniref:Uncharacterized protein n=1 Tax=Ananas comosus var. bracteatus TaxID=296719 RepID=A0A6V7PRZ8_ANACO|nr:unnamed protein product [Ananas comosus var. bracteatus]
MRTWFLRRIIACLPLCSFAHACEGRSLQAGTPEIAIATYARPCGIGRRSRLPWGRLIPRVGMLTTTGPLGMAQARQPSEVFDRALWVEHGDAHVREERELLAESKDKGKKGKAEVRGTSKFQKAPEVSADSVQGPWSVTVCHMWRRPPNVAM